MSLPVPKIKPLTPLFAFSLRPLNQKQVPRKTAVANDDGGPHLAAGSVKKSDTFGRLLLARQAHEKGRRSNDAKSNRARLRNQSAQTCFLHIIMCGSSGFESEPMSENQKGATLAGGSVKRPKTFGRLLLATQAHQESRGSNDTESNGARFRNRGGQAEAGQSK